MQRYRVKFKIDDIYNTITIPLLRGVADVINGFWVDVNYEYTVGEDAKYFVLPHQIRKLEKFDDGKRTT